LAVPFIYLLLPANKVKLPVVAVKVYHAQAESPAPRAVLGMLGVDGRELMRKRFRDDILTLTLPIPLFQRMEEEANDWIFQTPSWKRLVGC
jgi:hypothetical protein